MKNPKIGQLVIVYDKYRFAKPIQAIITEISDDGVRILLNETNSSLYKSGNHTLVFRQQLREDKGTIKDTITKMDLRHCPLCGGSTGTYRHPHAKVWCTKCNHVLREEGDMTIQHDERLNK